MGVWSDMCPRKHRDVWMARGILWSWLSRSYTCAKRIEYKSVAEAGSGLEKVLKMERKVYVQKYRYRVSEIR